MKHGLTINSDPALYSVLDEIQRLYKEHRYLSIRIGTGKQRSGQQRKAIEVFCNHLAQSFNDAGLDQRKVMAEMKEGVMIPWTQESVKESIFKEMCRKVLNKESTTELERDEVSKIYDILNRWTSDTFGVSVPWPHREEE